MADEFDVDGLLAIVLKELGRRLETEPENVPAHVLARMFDQAARLKKAEDEPVGEEDKRGLLEWIEEAGLPNERKQELLKEEILRLENQVGQAFLLLRELEDNDGAREAVTSSEPGSLHSPVLP